MADQPRKDLKTAPTLRDVTSGAKQASPLPPTDGASLDAFNTLAPVSAAGTAAEAADVKAALVDASNAMAAPDELKPDRSDTVSYQAPPPQPTERFDPAPTAGLGVPQPTGAAAEARQVEEAARARQEPALSQFSRGSESNSEPGSSQAASSVAGAASAAEVVREAARQRIEPAVSRDFTEQQPGVTEEAPASYADRVGVNVGEMLERLNPDVVGREVGIGEGQEAPAAFRDSGRDALAAQVDAAFDLGSDTGTQGRTPGRMGTPADLGVTGDFGTKAGLNAGSGAGMDLFNVGLPNRGVSGAANDLGLMQGITDGMSQDYSMSVAIGAAGEGDSRVAGGQTLVDEPPVDDTDPNTVPSGIPLEDTQEDTIQVDEFIPQVQEALETVREVVEQVAPYVIGGAILAGAAVAVGGSGGALLPAAAAALLAVSGAGESGAGDGKVPDPSNPGREGSGIIGPPTAAEMAVRAAARERLGLGSPGSGDVDPTDEGNESVHSVGPEPGARVFLQAGIANNATAQFLFGQPAGPEAGAQGRGSVDFGRLPGDMGNIDYGPDSTGAWSGNTMTENEADALGAFGGSGLTISDANRNDDDEEDTDDDDAS